MNVPDQNPLTAGVHIKEEDLTPLDLGINGNEMLLWEAYQEYKVLGYLSELHTGAQCTSGDLPPDTETHAASCTALDWLTLPDDDPFIVEYARTTSWPDSLGLGSPEALADAVGQDDVGTTDLPPYLMATGHLGSPRPEVEYGQRSLTKVKQETEIPTFPAFPDGFDERKSVTPDEKITRNRTAEKGSKKAAVKSKSFSPSRPLVERHKRHSDDDGDSVSSNLTDYTDGTDGSGTDGSNHAADGRVSTDGRRKMSRRDVEGMLAAAEHGGAGDAGLPSLPKIPTVPFAENAKRQRRDVSMSAPAVAARELRLKKKQREEHLITECMDLKAEAETMERDMREARAQLDRLREDAAYLRSLVKSQQSVVDLLQYLQNAPFFNKDGHTEPGLRLDGRSILRQISGSAQDEKTAKKEQAKEIGGICLHINGSSITLHLCSHCSSEAGSK